MSDLTILRKKQLNKNEKYIHPLKCADLILFLFFIVIYLFVNPIISMSIIGLYFVICKDNLYSMYLSRLWLILFLLLLFCCFSFRIYGFSLGDSLDDVPGYFRWYEVLNSTPSTMLFNREFVFWLPYSILSLFSLDLSFEVFVIIANAYIFILLFFCFYKFNKYSIAVIFSFLFIFHANIYSFAHIYRQSIALLFLLIAIRYYIKEGMFAKTYFFIFLSIFSHNSVLVFAISFFFVLMLSLRDVRLLILYFVCALLIILALIYIPNSFVSELGLKVHFYTGYDSNHLTLRNRDIGFDKQSIFVILFNALIFYLSRSSRIRKLTLALILMQIVALSIGLWSILARVSLLTIPVSIYIFFILITNNDYIMFKIKVLSKSIIIILLVSLGAIYTLLSGIESSQAILPLLSSGDFFNPYNGFVLQLFNI